MPLKRFLELFVGKLSWTNSLNFSGLSMDNYKIWLIDTNTKRIVVYKAQGSRKRNLFGIIYIKILRANQHLVEPCIIDYVAKVLLCDIS